jgi:molecular chaperone Hsp33
MHDRDCLHRFLFEHYPIRGHIVHLDAAWRALLEHHDYPVHIRDTLGEATAASVLLAATLKFDGTLSLQLQGQGPLHLMLAQCSSQLGVRAVARYRDSVATHDLASLSGEGNLTVTLENSDLSQRYQGVVPLSGNRLAPCLQDYFERSEQLPTRLWLHADEQSVCGMLLQRLSDDTVAQRPGYVGRHGRVALDPADVEDTWRRVQLLAETVKPNELHTLADRQLLQRLFAEDDIRLFDSNPVFFRCRCSRERVAGMLKSLGSDEIRSLLAERGSVEVSCDFCNRAYQFDAVDIEHLFNPDAHPERSGTKH